MFTQLNTMLKKPALYEKGAELWTDEHISKGMLAAHLDPNWDAATRNRASVKKIVEWIQTVAPAERHRDMLDLGCGPGIYAEEFHKAGYRVSGMDFSERSIDYARSSAREKDPPITYYCRNYLELDFVAQFDLITLIYYDFGVLSTEDRATLLQRAYTALKPGGLLIFDALTPRHYEDKRTEYRRFESADVSFFCGEPHIRLESFYVYEGQNTFCEQHILITEKGLKCINIWEHTFVRREIEQDVKDAGFALRALYGSMDGSEYRDDGKEMCVVAQKEGDI